MKTNKLAFIRYKNLIYISIDQLNEYKQNYLVDNTMLSFNDALQYLQVSHNTLEKAIRSQRITCQFIDKKRYFLKSDLDNIKENTDDLLTAKQAGEYLSMADYTVNKYAKQGKIKYVLKGVQPKFYYRKEDLDEYKRQTQEQFNNLYTIDQVIQYLNISRSSLHRLNKSNVLVPNKYIDKKPYYEKVQLDNYLKIKMKID